MVCLCVGEWFGWRVFVDWRDNNLLAGGDWQVQVHQVGGSNRDWIMDGRRTWTIDEAHWDCVTRSGIEWKRERRETSN